MASRCIQINRHSNWCIQITCQLAIMSQSDRSFDYCCLRGPCSWFSHNGREDAQRNCRMWPQGSQCIYYSNSWATYLWRSWWLDSWLSHPFHPSLWWSWSWSQWAAVAFNSTMGYTPRLGGLANAVVKRVVYRISFIIIPISLWCPPPCGVVRVTTLAYRSCIILLIP